MTQPSQLSTEAPKGAKNTIAALSSGIGGIIMMIAGIQSMRGHSNNLLFFAGFALLLVGMGLRGQLTKKIG